MKKPNKEDFINKSYNPSIELMYLKEYVEKLEEYTNHIDEKLLSAICQYTKKTTQSEILEVVEWLKTSYKE